jgi:hypothetical protein
MIDEPGDHSLSGLAPLFDIESPASLRACQSPWKWRINWRCDCKSVRVDPSRFGFGSLNPWAHRPTIARILLRNASSTCDSSSRRAAKRWVGAGIETAIGRPKESSVATPTAPMPLSCPPRQGGPPHLPRNYQPRPANGVSGATTVEYIPYHIASSRTTLHKIYHDAKRPSHLLLPIIPEAPDGERPQGETIIAVKTRTQS